MTALSVTKEIPIGVGPHCNFYDSLNLVMALWLPFAIAEQIKQTRDETQRETKLRYTFVGESMQRADEALPGPLCRPHRQRARSHRDGAFIIIIIIIIILKIFIKTINILQV